MAHHMSWKPGDPSSASNTHVKWRESIKLSSALTSTMSPWSNKHINIRALGSALGYLLFSSLLYSCITSSRPSRTLKSLLQSSLANTHSNFTLKFHFQVPQSQFSWVYPSFDSKLTTGAADVQVQGRLSNISLPESALHTSIPPCTCSWNQLFF